MWLSGSSFLPLRLDFSAGRRVYERARKILSQPWRLSLHYTGSCAHWCRLTALHSVHYARVYTYIYSVINNGIARLPASAYLPAMTVASVVRRPGGCCPSRRSSSAGASSETASPRDRWRSQIFYALYLVSNLSDRWARGRTFLLLQVSVAAT